MVCKVLQAVLFIALAFGLRGGIARAQDDGSSGFDGPELQSFDRKGLAGSEGVTTTTTTSSSTSTTAVSEFITPPTELGYVPPLDEWTPVETKKREEPRPKEVPPSKKRGAGLPLVDDFVDEEEDFEKEFGDARAPAGGVLPYERTTFLDKDKRLRLKAVRDKRYNRLWKAREELNQRAFSDGRGAPELRVCELNLENYGKKDDLKRYVRAAAGARLQKKIRATVSAIREARCDVVALQGIIGRSYASALEALEELEKKVEQATYHDWRSELGTSVHLLAYNGFLLRKNLSVVEVMSHRDKLLPRAAEFQEPRFGRSPFQISLHVPGKEGRPSRRVVILNFDLQSSLQPARPEPEEHRIQMAEGVRQLGSRAILLQPGASAAETAVLAVAGAFVGSPFAPATQVLEGRVRLADFDGSERCTIVTSVPESGKKSKKAKKKVPVAVPASLHCPKSPERPMVLFNALAESPLPPRRFKKVEKDGVQTWERLPASKEERKFEQLRKAARTKWRSSLFFLQSDLELLKVSSLLNHQYSVGAVPVDAENDNVLTWVDINW